MTGKKGKIRVMIVEDSLAVMELLKAIIGSDPRLEVAAAVDSGEEALEILHRAEPDVISLDIRLPGINGFEVTQEVMRRRPTPIVVVSASVEAEDLKISMNALRAGALAVVEKPEGVTHEDFETIAQHLCTQLVIMSEVKVVKQRIQRKIDLPAGRKNGHVEAAGLFRPVQAMPGGGNFKVLGLCASTGGPNALMEILGKLPRDFPLPVLVVQHITQSFLDGFVSWLGSLCELPVVMVEHKETMRPGKIYVASPDRHLLVEMTAARSYPGPPVCQQRPSATVLFQSMAEHYRQNALGVLLTGMGEDGAEGLKAIKDAGGYTIAEDQTTAVVYGMPGTAVRIGAACESLPLPQIAPRLLELAAMAENVNKNHS
jgi:two-component system chemotaxis response regulator CheB